MIPPFNPNHPLFTSQLPEVTREVVLLDPTWSFEDFERFCLAKLDSLDTINPDQIKNLENLDQFLNCDITNITERFNHRDQFRILKILFTLTQKIQKNFDYEIDFDLYSLKSSAHIMFFCKTIENKKVLRIEINDPLAAMDDLFLADFKEFKELFSENELYIVFYTLNQEEEVVKKILNICGSSLKEVDFSAPNQKFLNQFLENCPRLKEIWLINSGLIEEINLTGLRELTFLNYTEDLDVKKSPTFHWSDNILTLDLNFQIPFTIDTLPPYLTDLSIQGKVDLITAPVPNLTFFNAIKTPFLKELPCFSSNLKILSLISCYNLEDLKTIPDSVEDLSIHGCKKLEIIDHFPTHLKELTISKCLNLKRIPCFPLNLEKIGMRLLNEIEEFPTYPESLQVLYLGDNLPFDKLPEALPKNLKSLTYNHQALPDLAYQMYLLELSLLLDKEFTLTLISNVYDLLKSNEILKNQYQKFIDHLIKKLPFSFIYDSFAEISKIVSPESFPLFHLKIWNQEPFKYLEMNYPIYISTRDFLQNTPPDPIFSSALEILGYKINFSKINQMMEKSFLKKVSLIPSDYDSVNIEELFPQLFCQINFESPEKPFYVDPTHLKDGQTSLSVDYLKEGLFKLITNIKEKNAYVGVPEEPILREAYYATVEKQLKQLLALVQNAFLKKNDLDAFFTARTELIKIAIAGHYCGARWFNDPKDAIKVMTGNLMKDEEFLGIVDLFEKWIKEDLFQQIEHYRKELTKLLGISNEIHIHNQIGRLLSLCGIHFEEGTFQLDDPIGPIDNIYLIDIIMDKIFSPIGLIRMIWDLSFNLLGKATKITTNREESLTSHLLLEGFPEMMRGVAEKIAASEVAIIEKKLPKIAFLKGKEILEKKLNSLKITANNLEKKIEVKIEDSFITTSAVHETQKEEVKKKNESLKRKRSSEEPDETLHKKQKIQGIASTHEKETIFFKLKDRKDKLAYLKTQIMDYEKILEKEKEYEEKLKEMGMESARSSILIEKQFFLDSVLEKYELFLFDQETFEMKVTAKGIFFALCYLGILEELQGPPIQLNNFQ